MWNSGSTFAEKVANLSAGKANAAMLAAIKHKGTFIWLEPPASLGAITVADIVKAENAEQHMELVREWARTAWDAWSDHHDMVRTWVAA